MLHAVYEQIHDMAGKKKYHTQAQEKLEELVAISRTLLEQIDILEEEVNAIPG